VNDAVLLRAEGLSCRFGDVAAVDGISLEVRRGEVFALLGESGSGKSTLLRLLAGLQAPSAGRIWLGGEDITTRPPYERPVNLMFQHHALFPHLSARDNIAFGLERLGLPRAEVGSRVDQLLAMVRLAPKAARKPHQLSGGEQQRVALARALARRPRLLLLDEPLAALDRGLREQTRTELLATLAATGTTCIVVTHDPEDAMAMADRIAVMHAGRVRQVGTPREIYHRPATREVAALVGHVNLIERTDDGAGDPVTLALRPERVGLARERPAGDVDAVAGLVRRRKDLGSTTQYQIETADGVLLRVSLANTGHEVDGDYRDGDPVWAYWSRSSPVALAP